MKNTITIPQLILVSTLAAGALWLAGCASSGEPSSASSSAGAATTGGGGSPFAKDYKTDDGRNISIGKATAADGGWRFKEPHMDKCWLADGFNFTGIDTLYIAPVTCTAKYNPDGEKVLQIAKENIPIEIERQLRGKGLFAKIVTRESEIPTNAVVARMENNIIEFSKGGGAGRYFAGLYGGGQPVVKVQGKLTVGEKTDFTYEMRRSGTSAGARMGGVFMKDEDIQTEDIKSLGLDLSDFMAAVGGKYQAR